MKYDLKKPCANCPFRSDRFFPLNEERVSDIVLGNTAFACHKTVDYSQEHEVEDDNGCTPSSITAESQHCAGLLIMLEHMERPHQMMRIMERLGGYDRSNLDMDAPVYKHLDEYILQIRKND